MFSNLFTNPVRYIYIYLPGVLKKGSVNCAVFLVIVVGKLFKPV